MQNHRKMKYRSVQTDLTYVPLKKRGKKRYLELGFYGNWVILLTNAIYLFIFFSIIVTACTLEQ